MLSHIGGADKACLKTVQTINKGMLLTGMLVSSSCETALGALCLQRALGWSCSLGWNSLLCTQRCQHSPGDRNAGLGWGNVTWQCHSTASLPKMSLQQQWSVVTPQAGSLRGRKMQRCAQGCHGWQSEVLPGTQDTILSTRGHDPSIRAGCLKAGSGPCSASLVPSTTGTITARWRSALFTAALLTISHWQKICTQNTALRNSEKDEDFFLAILPLRSKKSHFLSRQDLMLTRPSPAVYQDGCT